MFNARKALLAFCLLFIFVSAPSHAGTSSKKPSANHKPIYWVTVIRPPRPWVHLQVNGFTDSGMVWGDVTNGEGMNGVRGHGFIWKNGHCSLVPDPPIGSLPMADGDQFTLESISLSGKPTLRMRKTSWDGAWMGTDSAAYSNYKAFKGRLPGLKIQSDVSSCYQDKDGNLYVDCYNGSDDGSRMDDPRYNEVHLLRWHDRKVDDLGQGSALGIGADGWFYAKMGDSTVKFVNGSEKPIRVDEMPVKQAESWGVTVGSKSMSDETESEHAVVEINGKIYDLNHCVTNIPRGQVLTEADFINKDGQILALMDSANEECGPCGGDPDLLTRTQ